MKNKKSCSTDCNSAADLLNRTCFCKTLKREELLASLQAQSLPVEVLQHFEQLFSHTAVFISPVQWQQLQLLVQTVMRVTALPAYQQAVLSRAPAIAHTVSPVSGVFMGFDFHLNEDGPHIIEINTNAGGAFLNAILLSAQTACCNAAGDFPQLLQPQVEAEFVAMFRREWQLARGDQILRCIALVDENPSAQFLYPEFLLAQGVFERAGIKTLIVDPRELDVVDGKLCYQQQVIDLVYNRLTDFSLTQPGNSVLRYAYENNLIVLTPNPYHHALYADKRNLALLSDETKLNELGVSNEDIKTLLVGIPRTQLISADNAELLWQERKQLFFKPAAGYGSKATYRGDKITKRVWDEILQGDYVAQRQIPPSERGILVDEQEVALKMDVRAYVYNSEIQLLAARLYQGQTTNFRTQGGGFAPVFVAE
ncbi:hypothetical protein [Cellvibrio sp. PSBB023]|uniref:hypothetical protein n=1 Tax=Cellvibrio sp. PSBB023 TaxID=1945512 RepID=UPI00098EA0BB|nr:hypothetical protein [Cellvibrio sp. PSBB023]AQT61124.1 hypothetical protein B0D95_14235 [Cellvibrio sp. PSBB023]